MTQFNFGIGALICKRTDITGTLPMLIGTVQDTKVDISVKIEELRGQFGYAVAFGAADRDIKGTSKFARLQTTQFQNLILNGTQTTGMLEMTAPGEQHTIPGSPFQVTATNSATWTEDVGVFFVTGGAQLTSVPSSPAQGQYSVSAGVYTFNTADSAAAVLLFYKYTINTGNQIAINNPLMGPLPTFELNLKGTFNYFGVQKDIVLVLNACVSDKLSMPFANNKFVINEFSWMAGADQNNNVGTLSLTE